MERVSLGPPLGSYPNRDEFQIETTIVWVMYPEHGDRAHWLVIADCMIDEVWDAIPSVLSLAAESTRRAIPDCWAKRQAAAKPDEPLAVLGIWIDPAIENAEYHVAEKSADGFLRLPECYAVQIARNAEGSLTVKKKS